MYVVQLSPWQWHQIPSVPEKDLPSVPHYLRAHLPSPTLFLSLVSEHSGKCPPACLLRSTLWSGSQPFRKESYAKVTL